MDGARLLVLRLYGLGGGGVLSISLTISYRTVQLMMLEFD